MRRSRVVACLGIATVALLLASSSSAAAGPPTIVAISAGNFDTCALTSGGGVLCWGWNGDGELGDGTTGPAAPTPVAVTGLSSGAAAVSVGGTHVCALTSAGGVKCWGANYAGQLGDGTTDNSSTPVGVSGLSSGVVAISAGYDHSCALTSGGGVKCWGANDEGQLGDSTLASSSTPVAVSGLTSGVVAISAGRFYTCALTSGGGVFCWGFNGFAQLGDNLPGNSPAPVGVFGLTHGISAISTDETHTCALLSAGGVLCWGYDGFGELGNGENAPDLIVPVPANAAVLTDSATAISLGGNHTCALTSTHGVKCWGYNGDGELGDGTTVGSLFPVVASGLSGGVNAISAAGGLETSHTCALTTVGGVKCWGWNLYGQLGDGTTVNRSTPVDVVFPGSGGGDGGGVEPPTASLARPKEGADYKLGQVVTASYRCAERNRKGPGLASCVGDVANGHAIDTATVGDHTFTVTATDTAGNATTVTHHYHVHYAFTGFFSPVTNSSTSKLNLVHAGDLIKVAFGLGGDQGLSIGTFSSSPVACPDWTPHSVKAAGSGSTAGLSFGVSADHYTYGWQTDVGWAGTCRQFSLQLDDGTAAHTAVFQFFG
jgi:alpha-tubulin suppressor-like RCC1 family protein